MSSLKLRKKTLTLRTHAPDLSVREQLRPLLECLCGNFIRSLPALMSRHALNRPLLLTSSLENVESTGSRRVT